VPYGLLDLQATLMKLIDIKKRWIIKADEASYQASDGEIAPNYNLIITTTAELPENARDGLTAHLGEAVLTRRLEHPNVTLYLWMFQNKQPAAFVWLLHPSEQPIWHDNFATLPGHAYVFNGFTFPEHRKKGLYYAIMHKAMTDALYRRNLKSCSAVVEAKNVTSFKTTMKLGYQKVATNHLIKVLNRNIFSIYRDLKSGRWKVNYVFGKIDRYRL
jgi:RimJ/RimL family protein N-acetyltransferase